MADSPSQILESISALVANKDAAALVLLEGHADKKVRKAARKAIHKLRSRGVEIPDADKARTWIQASSDELRNNNLGAAIVDMDSTPGATRFMIAEPAPEERGHLLLATVTGDDMVLDFGAYVQTDLVDAEAEATFEADTGPVHHRIHIGASALAAPLPNADPGAASAIAALLQAQLDARASSGPLQQRVRRVLAASFRRDEREFPDAARVAEQLGCSPRTLRRDLMAQGTSYRELADEVRCRLAIEALRSRELTVAQVGERLGYRDTANFRRAFKRWTGRVPADYREG